MLCTENCLAFLHYRCSLLERTEYLWWEQQTGHRSLMMLFSGIRIFSLIWVWSYHACYEQQVLLLSVLIINFLLIRQSCLARINYLASQRCLSSFETRLYKHDSLSLKQQCLLKPSQYFITPASLTLLFILSLKKKIGEWNPVLILCEYLISDVPYSWRSCCRFAIGLF